MKTVPALFDLACDMVGRRKLRALSCSPPVLVTIEVRKSQVDRKMGLRYRQLSCAERIAQRTSKERQLTLNGVCSRELSASILVVCTTNVREELRERCSLGWTRDGTELLIQARGR